MHTAPQPAQSGEAELYRRAFWQVYSTGLVIITTEGSDLRAAADSFAVALREWEDTSAAATPSTVKALENARDLIRKHVAPLR